MANVFDASQIPGAVQEMKEAKSLNDLMGEPMQITYIRQLNVPPKNGQPARTSYVGEYTSLATDESGEVWLPDRQGQVLLKFMQENADAVFQGRWFKDPTIGGEVKRGWQFLGVDQIPEDKGNKAVYTVSGKVNQDTMQF